MRKLENKIAIVTGGAMGNGFGIVKVFLKYGAKVIILDYDEFSYITAQGIVIDGVSTLAETMTMGV